MVTQLLTETLAFISDLPESKAGALYPLASALFPEPHSDWFCPRITKLTIKCSYHREASPVPPANQPDWQNQAVITFVQIKE